MNKTNLIIISLLIILTAYTIADDLGLIRENSLYTKRVDYCKGDEGCLYGDSIPITIQVDNIIYENGTIKIIEGKLFDEQGR